MAKLPLILSIVALVFASGLGIAAKKKADRKMGELAATQTELKSTKSTLATTTGERDKANTSLAAAEKEIEVKGDEVTKLTGDVTAAKDELKVSLDTIGKRDEKVVSLENEIRDLGKNVEAKEAARLALQEQLDVAKKEGTEVKLAYEQIKERLQNLESKMASASSPASTSGPRTALRSGTIVAVNAGLNYVVLSVGDQQGVSVNTSLVVLRGGQRVATLKVTSIEPRASVAEVVPGTLAKGQAVQVGDRVVPAGASAERKMPAPAVVPASAPAKVGRGDAGVTAA